MEHPDNIDTVRIGPVEDQVFWKSLDAPDANALRFGMSKETILPHLRVVGQKAKCTFGSVKKPSGRGRTVLSNIIGLLNQIT